jgi:hypothetical protein
MRGRRLKRIAFVGRSIVSVDGSTLVGHRKHFHLEIARWVALYSVLTERLVTSVEGPQFKCIEEVLPGCGRLRSCVSVASEFSRRALTAAHLPPRFLPKSA